MSGARVTINGQTYEAPAGASLSVINGVIYVDGKKVEDIDNIPQPIKIEVDGPIGNVEVHGSLDLEGNVEGDVYATGNVSCSEVQGDVEAGGNVSVGGNAGLNVDAGGNVSVGGKVLGNVGAGGNVSHR
jgi:hypothetical protein